MSTTPAGLYAADALEANRNGMLTPPQRERLAAFARRKRGRTDEAADALEANRNGMLTPPQRERLAAFARRKRGRFVSAAGVCLVLGLVLVQGPALQAPRWLLVLAGIACLALAAFLAVRATGLGDDLTRDVRDGRVESVEGPLGKRQVRSSASQGSYTLDYLVIAGERYPIFTDGYAAAPDAGYVRLYLLPRSRRVVNLERIHGPGLPEGLLDTPGGALGAVASVVRGGGGLSGMRSRLEALGAAFAAEMEERSTPPPLSRRDPRPLDQAIQGAWTSAMFSVSFAADGTLRARLPGGQEQDGRWSVEADGRLHADLADGPQAGEAWVVGDTLTLVLDGVPVTLRRG